MHFSILKKLYLKEGQMNKVKLGKKQLLYYSFMKCFRIFPIDRKKIVVSILEERDMEITLSILLKI